MAGAKALFGALSNLIPKSAYRSRLEPAIEALPQEKMTPEQALGSFKKFPGGVGEDELQYTGIKGILEQGQPVTKTSLLEQVRSNPLEITDVYKADSLAKATRPYQIEMLPKFGQYTLPGGSNYQELLMTLPEEKAKFSVFSGDTRIMDETFSSGSEARTAALEEGLGEIGYSVRQTNSPQNFKSSHYDESNILAHGRYNTRTIDGDKTLFIEEIQSDWHQAGRDKGYKGVNDISDIRLKEIERDKKALENASGGVDDANIQAYDELLGDQEKLSNEIPDAPYKSTDKWAGLTFNRMLKQAVDSGHDRIAWTSGQIQADRYDLSKRVGEITYEPNSKQLNVYGKIENHDDDFSPFISEIVESENLADFIGKEASERLLASRQSKFTQGGPEGIVEKKHHLIKGKDLEIGGEGMKEFYDKILPKISGKIAKKYNSKVEVSADSLYDANPDLIQGTGRNKIDAIENARDEVRYDGSGRLVPDADEYKAIQVGDVWEAYFDYDVGKGQQVWSMKITPEMKKAVAGGVALSGAGVAVLPEGSK